MILEIRLSNFFSIKEEVVLDLRGGNIQTKQAKDLEDNVFEYGGDKILKTVAMYGANASGKSNIIKAIQFCCKMVFMSHNHNEDAIFNFTPFKFENFENKPSKFFIRFVSNEIEHEYSFELTRKDISRESLFYYPNGRITKIFTRDETIKGNKAKKYSFGKVIKRPLDVAENTTTKTLYVSRASQMDREKGKEIFNFFTNTFLIDYVNFETPHFEQLFHEYKPFIITALQIADSDIVDIKLKKEKVPVKTLNAIFPENIATIKDDIGKQLKITTYHRAAPNIPFDFETEESEGTRRFLIVLLSILLVVKKNKVLLVDEIERSFHSKIVEFIIKLFNASKSAQLIYSTHNTYLLDLVKFRKDQIYFVNKKQDSSTDLYSLFDYKDFREKMNLEHAYLQGRFDAIPFIDDSMASIKSLINGKE